MKCPFCGGNMEPGNIFQGRGMRVTWYPEGEHAPYSYNLKSSLKHGGVPLSQAGLGRFYGLPCTAYICRACGKGVFDIPPLEEARELV